MRKLIGPVVILLIIFLIAKGWWDSQFLPLSTDKTTQIFVVEKNETFSKIVDQLKTQKLIKSDWAFTILAKQTGLGASIQAGTFRLSPSFSASDILNILSSQPLDNWVTLLEGWRVEEMAQKLNEDLKIDNGQFIKIAREGYMFPDTYLFPKDYSEQQIAKKLRDTFDLKYSDDIKTKITNLGLTEAQGVILASIVEREARSDQARTEVASILLKRLQIGMALDTDATIQYALGFQKSENPPAGGWWKKNLTADDFKVDSLYNTYTHAGLPPTPICNPSLSSLQAVANADSSTPYLYYYHDSKGVSHYAKTLEEHNQNIANYP